MNSSSDLIKKMKHNYQLHKWLEKISILLFIKEKIGLLRNLAFIIAITINGMVLFSYERDTGKLQPATLPSSLSLLCTDGEGNLISVNLRKLFIYILPLNLIVNLSAHQTLKEWSRFLVSS